jgi:hypothetical protein
MHSQCLVLVLLESLVVLEAIMVHPYNVKMLNVLSVTENIRQFQIIDKNFT